MATKVTLHVDDALKKRLEAEAAKLGIGWTTMLRICAIEGLDARDAKAKANG